MENNQTHDFDPRYGGMSRDTFITYAEREGYSYLRVIDNKVCGIMPMLFTVGVFIDLNMINAAGGRICFKDLHHALAFINNWDGKTAPVVGKDGCTADKRRKEAKVS